MLNYRKKNINGVCFKGRNLSAACLWGVTAKSSDFSGSQMIDSDCRIGNFSYADFTDAYCQNINFSGAVFDQTNFSGTDLSKAVFSSPSIFTCIFTPNTCLEDTIYCYLGEENFWLADLLEKTPLKTDFFFRPQKSLFKNGLTPIFCTMQKTRSKDSLHMYAD